MNDPEFLIVTYNSNDGLKYVYSTSSSLLNDIINKAHYKVNFINISESGQLSLLITTINNERYITLLEL